MIPALKLKLTSQVAGVLKSVPVDRGALVKKGQLVAQLYDDVDEGTLALDNARAGLDAVIAGRKARVEFLQRKQGRLTQLAAKADATPAQLDEVDTDLRLATGDLREAEKNQELARLEVDKQRHVIEQHTVLSPIDGIVTERSLYVGEYAYEQSPIMTVTQIDPLNVEVYLPTALYNAVAVGMTVEVHPEAPLDQTYRAEVKLIDRVFDPQSGTFGVRLTLPNPDGKLPAGLRCHAKFIGVQAP